MRLKENSVLGISVGTHVLGLAVLKGNSLEDWGVKTFTGKWSKLKLRIILLAIERYIDHHSISSVAVKTPHISRTSPGLRELQKGIERLLERKGINCCTYGIEELKRSYSNIGKLNKASLFEAIKTRYPELHTISNKQKNNKRDYYIKIIEAIAAVEYCKSGKQ